MFDKLPPKILVIESNKEFFKSLLKITEKSRFNFVNVSTLENALTISSSAHPPDLIIIDSIVQDKPALTIISQIKRLDDLANLPVIFLLNPDQPASDYISEKNNLSTMLTKPFTPDQLMTAIRSLLKRSNLVLQDKILRYKELSMDLTTYQVLKKDKSIRLGPTEFKILQLFMQSPKIIFSRQNIIDKVWGINKNIALRTVDVHINRIRLSLKGNGPDEFIKTTRSAGYHLDVSNDTEDHHPIN